MQDMTCEVRIITKCRAIDLILKNILLLKLCFLDIV